MRLWPALLPVALAFASTTASADDTHYQDILVGGRSIALGGAFTSIADDPSGPYYNPAGLGDARSTNLQVSTSLYGFERGSIPNGLVSPVPGVDKLKLDFTDLIIIPASAGFVSTFGGKDADGNPYQAYGLSVIVPSYRSFTAGAAAQDPSQQTSTAGTQNTYDRRVTDRELWTGLGYGRRLSNEWRVGVSGYYILRSVTDREHVTVSQPLDNNLGDKFQDVTDDISYINGSVVFIGGVRWTPLPRWAFGFSASTPSIPIHSQMNLSFSRASADPSATTGPVATIENLSITGGSRTAYSPTFRLGGSYSRPYRYTLSADVSYHMPTSYTLIEPMAADRARFDTFRSRLPFDPEVHRQGVINANVGAEFLIVREVSIGGGFFTDFSSARSVPASPIADQPPDVNLFGMSMAIGYFGSHTLSRLGIIYSYGTGHDVIPTSDVNRVLSGEQTFKRVPYFQSFFYVFLSSTFRY
jgi:hypothetical protein